MKRIQAFEHGTAYKTFPQLPFHAAGWPIGLGPDKTCYGSHEAFASIPTGADLSSRVREAMEV